MATTKISYPLTPLQQGLLYNSLTAPETGVEIEQIVFTANEPLNLEAFTNAWQQVVDAQPILRTRVQWEGDKEPCQIIEPSVSIAPAFHDWQELSPVEQESHFSEYMKTDRLIDFDQSKAPLMRLALFSLASKQFKCIWTFHHALMDGRSFPIIIRDVFDCYEAYCKKSKLQLVSRHTFGDYVDWLLKRDLAKDEEFWQQTLQGFSSSTPIPITFSAQINEKIEVNATEEIRLSESLSSNLRSFAEAHGLTLNTLVQGAWALLLHHYSSENDVVFGTTWSCRYSTIEGAESIVGLLINTLPMRIKISDHQLLLPWLKKLRKQHIELRKYFHTPLNKIRQWSDVSPGTPLFESLVVFENFLLGSTLRAQGGQWLNRNFHYRGQTNFPLVLACYDDVEILMRIEYQPNRFDKATIQRLLGHIQIILDEMPKASCQLAIDVPYLSGQERNQLLVEWNDTQSKYPRDVTIHELFEAQVEQNPNSVAVTFQGVSLTYLELNAKANQLAHRLQSLGVKPETKVGFYIERSLELIVGILAILKAGGAYVPLDPEYPEERLLYMFEDTCTPVLLIHANQTHSLPKHDAQIVPFDVNCLLETDQSAANPKPDTYHNNLAYVMYTSGSTGKPKGIEVTHRNVIRLVKNTNYIKFDRKEVFLHYAPIAFDASTLEIWGALLNGGQLVICPPSLLSPEELGEIIKRNHVTTVWLTSGLFHNIVEYNLECLSSVRQILAGGDVLAPSSVKKVLSDIPGVCLVNGYGPTENTTFTCCYPMSNNCHVGTAVPIGRPISNTKVYLLDKHMRPVPIGVPAELYTSGDGVARGYLNRPELTDRVFLPNPFSEDRESRLYKTGDLARYLPDGNIEFLGRIDNQVKLRGFRIELGEIESVLSMHEAVSQVVALVREDRPGDKRLVGYFVPQIQVDNLPNELHKYLEEKLPQHMMPQHLVEVENFPLTANGKIDRKALSPPIVEGAVQGGEFINPKNETQEKMVKLWHDTLGVKHISILDNFFNLGGHSLMAVQLFSKISKEFSIDLPLATLFKAPTVEKISELVEKTMDKQKDKVLPKASSTISHNWKHLVPIQPNGNRPPLFCMHAVGGNVLNYQIFTPKLGQDQPLYGLQSRGLDGLENLHEDIESMACEYIREVLMVQPHGPYYLGGASMGGNIALEVAQQLTMAGEKVAYLVMFDTPGPGYFDAIERNPAISTLDRLLKHHIPILCSLSKKEQFEYTFQRAKARVIWQIKMSICIFFHMLKYPIPHKLRYWYVEQNNTVPAQKYKPKPFKGKLTLFTDSTDEENCDLEKGWQPIFANRIEIVKIPAKHYEFVEEPMVAKELKRTLFIAQEEQD